MTTTRTVRSHLQRWARATWTRLRPRSVCLRLRLGLGLAGAALVLTGAGCSAVPYYSQAISGEISLLAAARPISDWLDDPTTSPELRERLQLAERIRTFASQELALPQNRSYTRYADLHRSSAVWNVFATPALSLTLKTWCYPVFGCAAYRGYFTLADAQKLSDELTQQGLDATVAPVPAFSTLGWFADPLLSTFVRWPEPELARLIFHELAHQIVYVPDDTRFNESFATAVEQEGLARWVARRQDAALRMQYEHYQLHHAGLMALVAQTRAQLQDVYAAPLPDAERLARKRVILAQLPERYRTLRDTQWQGYRGYDDFFLASWNNARIAALAAYQDDVPAFTALLASVDGDLPRFFARVKELAALSSAERTAALQSVAATTALGNTNAGFARQTEDQRQERRQ